MSALIRVAAVLLFVPTLAFGATLRGVVRTIDGTAVAGASISAGSASTTSAADGSFALDLPATSASVRVTHPAYAANEVRVSADVSTEVTLSPAFAETMEVSGIRAEDRTPVTKTNITREEIESAYFGQDLPLLMRDAPSIHAYAESGTGASGYSYITLRGVSPSRINYTLDGVPLADSEDMGTYFVDFPDLARSLQSVQIQRGVGTSTVGSPSFGGSINLQSIDVSSTRHTEAEVTLGAFGTRAATIAAQSGSLPGGLSGYARLSVLGTDGFREHSRTDQRNLFFSLVRQDGASLWKLTGFTAREEQQSSFYAADEETLKTNLRENPMDPDESDAFNYDLAQVQYLRPMGDGADLAASVYYQRGYGAFLMFDDREARENLRAYGLDGLLLGSLVTYSRADGALKTNAGVHVNRFRREHTSTLINGPRDYFNEGLKQEANAFAKLNFDTGGWNLFADLQVRRAGFEYEGDVDIRPVTWTFFNPRAGVSRALGNGHAYVSLGTSRREPARSDMFLGQDNPTVAHELRAVKPEQVVDLEAGWEFSTSTLAVAANVYAMEFRNEIAATGELTDLGMSIRRNVDRSYRRGVELDINWRPVASVRLKTDASVSRNRIAQWTQFFDVYDADGEWIDSAPVTYRNVRPILSPSYIINQGIEYTPFDALTTGLTGRWIGRSYLDNTQSRRHSIPSFFTLDANASISLERWIPVGSPRLSIQVNNVLNDRTVYGSGYSYQYINRTVNGGDEFAGTNYFFPQATRHAVVRLGFRL